MSDLLNIFDMETEHYIYNWKKQLETTGLNKDFIDEIYDMPESKFIQNVLNHNLPELEKIPIPKGTMFPMQTTINTNTLAPLKLIREFTQVPDTFHEWLYQFRFMLQYFTIEQMFDIFHLNDFAYGVNEPNAWIDNALEQMYNDHPDEECTQENDDEFLYNLNWDIEKGNLSESSRPKLSLFLPEEVGMIENELSEETQPNTLKQKRT